MLAGVGRIGRIGGAGSGSAGLTGFVSVWATTGAFETITIPCQNVGTFNAVIDWGDGTPTSTITTYNDADLAHVYEYIGDHTISITGTFPNIYMNNGAEKTKIKKVTNLGTVGWTVFNNAFQGCSNLSEFTVGAADTSAVTVMGNMLLNCSSLTSVDLSLMDTTLVTNMDSALFGCSSMASVDVSGWNTGACTRLAAMFLGCSALTSIVGVEDWDITGLNTTGDLTNFLTGGKMTTAQYDNLLVKWQAQVQLGGIPAMTASFGASIHSPTPSAAYTAKVLLVAFFSWTISDGVTP